MNQTSSDLNRDSKREALNPVPNENRIFGLSSYIPFWISSMVVIQIFIVGQTFVPPNGSLNMQQAVWAAIISAIIVAFMFTFNSYAGVKYGIPFIVQARSAFGYNGARIASLIRVLPAVFWYGVGSWIGAQAISYITDLYWGWSNTMLYFLIFQVLQTALAYYGIETAKWFNSYLSVIVIGFLIYINYKLLTVGNLEINESWKIEGTWGYPFFASISAAVGILITGAINNADISRYLKNTKKDNWIGHFVGIIPTFLLLVFTGILAAAVTGIWDPVQALVSVVDNPTIAVLMLIFIVVAQVTTNLTLNIIPPAMVVMETFNVRWGISAIIVGILGIVTFPWLLLTNAAFNTFIGYYSAFLGPLLGILLTDFYFIRKKEFNIPKLYSSDIKYNWIGLLSLVIGGAIGIVFYEISWMVSLPVSSILYWAGYKLFPSYKRQVVEVVNNDIVG
ncbi:NCS1 family transporter [Neobacillus mesonae]|uniref:NCS1 family transporter n=1 Tax=Neobacillus mesonae TaxID=1193713 RepID=UPI002E1F903D|nr:NCS1 family transporter [Neobacillus mesonae]